MSTEDELDVAAIHEVFGNLDANLSEDSKPQTPINTAQVRSGNNADNAQITPVSNDAHSENLLDFSLENIETPEVIRWNNIGDDCFHELDPLQPEDNIFLGFSEGTCFHNLNVSFKTPEVVQGNNIRDHPSYKLDPYQPEEVFGPASNKFSQQHHVFDENSFAVVSPLPENKFSFWKTYNLSRHFQNVSLNSSSSSSIGKDEECKVSHQKQKTIPKVKRRRPNGSNSEEMRTKNSRYRKKCDGKARQTREEAVIKRDKLRTKKQDMQNSNETKKRQIHHIRSGYQELLQSLLKCKEEIMKDDSESKQLNDQGYQKARKAVDETTVKFENAKGRYECKDTDTVAVGTLGSQKSRAKEQMNHCKVLFESLQLKYDTLYHIQLDEFLDDLQETFQEVDWEVIVRFAEKHGLQECLSKQCFSSYPVE